MINVNSLKNNDFWGVEIIAREGIPSLTTCILITGGYMKKYKKIKLKKIKHENTKQNRKRKIRPLRPRLARALEKARERWTEDVA